MALRIRTDGRILCAAMHEAEHGDTYIDDSLHYILSVVNRVLVTEEHDDHVERGEWWWRGSVPTGVTIPAWRMVEPTVEEINAEMLRISRAEVLP
jgi:hypothetical protein